MVLLASGVTVRVTNITDGASPAFTGVTACGGKPSGDVIELPFNPSDVLGVVRFVSHVDPTINQMIQMEGSMHEHAFILRPEAGREAELGAMMVKFKSPSSMNADQFIDAVRVGVTRWMRQTHEGADAWDKSHHVFSLYHLRLHLADQRLSILLSSVGIIDLKILPVDLENRAAETVLGIVAELAPRPPVEIPPLETNDPDADKDNDPENITWDSGRKEPS